MLSIPKRIKPLIKCTTSMNHSLLLNGFIQAAFQSFHSFFTKFLRIHHVIYPNICTPSYTNSMRCLSIFHKTLRLYSIYLTNACYSSIYSLPAYHLECRSTLVAHNSFLSFEPPQSREKLCLKCFSARNSRFYILFVAVFDTLPSWKNFRFNIVFNRW